MKTLSMAANGFAGLATMALPVAAQTALKVLPQADLRKG